MTAPMRLSKAKLKVGKVNGQEFIKMIKEVEFDLDDVIEYIGDCRNPKSLNKIADKLRIDSKVPTSRFGREDSGSEGTITFATEGVEQEEIRFSKFVNRLRSIYQEILIKPLWVQFCLDFPEKKNDYLLKSEFGLDYIKENNFTKGKEMDVLVARKDQIIKISGLKNSEGKPYFSMDFVVDRFLGMDGTEKENNQRFKKIAKEKKEKEGGEEPKEGEAAKEEFKL